MTAVGSGPAVSSAASDWTAWERVNGLPALSADVLSEILDGGQAFRWQRIATASGSGAGSAPGARGPASASGPFAADEWLGVWGKNVVRLRRDENERVEWSAPTSIAAGVRLPLDEYFATGRDFATLSDTLPWRSDPHLARCLIAFHGLRILRQPLGETLLGFLCSATKQIVQIKQMVALLAERHGAPIAMATGSFVARRDLPARTASAVFHRLPTWSELAEIPEATLRQCLLGFRARYISETAKVLARSPGWLEETESLPYAAAKERLCSLPGVGEKVADCVLLFGAGRLESFPVDVWILKTMARRYALERWRPAQLAQFGRVHFGPLAGLAQQYLFAWERRHGKTVTG
ncbi:MAG: DNA glycosylase [Opitutaceae bacterium]|nr:DNA glycosylase [Opitutaceae bacterium]